MRMKKWLCFVFSALIFLGSLSGCAQTDPKDPGTRVSPEDPVSQTHQTEKQNGSSISLTDQAGRTVFLEQPAVRIVSGYYIASSACLALGLADRIVGLEEKSEKRPIYELAAPGLSRSTVCVGSAKNFDVEACLSANPDLVILPKKARDYADVLEEAGVKSIVVDPEDNERLDEMIRMIALLTGTQERGNQLIQARADIMASAAAKAAKVSSLPKVYFCQPSTFMGTSPKDLYQAELIRKAGGINAGDLLDGSSWTAVSAEQLLAMDPDLIVVPCNSTATGRPDYENELFKDENFATLKAVQEGRVCFMPYGIESWDSPVPAGILGIMWMIHTLHPELVSQEELDSTVSSFYSEFYGFEAEGRMTS